MKKIIAKIFVLIWAVSLFADEGMWVPIFLKGYPIEQMQARGLKLTAEDIYSINQASMKDAVVLFGGGCTGSIISPDGLLITNHHCGYSYIVNHSTVEHDYLTNGFWAMSRQEELPNPGLTVKFLKYMEDVTDKILPKIPENITELERQKLIYQLKQKIIDSVENYWQGKYEATIKDFFYGNQFILIVTQTYKDVRLVGAPPSAIGKFGGETDNWMWPRHSGDFALFRIYADKNNEPAEYSPNNIPYRPKKFFKISLKGYQEGDFTMVIGYPGRTQQYIPSYAVEAIVNVFDPARIKIRQAKLDILMPALNESPQIRLLYAKQVSRIANGWKKWKGEIAGLKRLKAIKKKKEFEQKFIQWTKTPQGQKYADILNQYKNLYKQITPLYKKAIYFAEVFSYTPTFKYASNLHNTLLSIEQSNGNNIKQLKQKIITLATNYNKKHVPIIEQRLLNKILAIYINDMDKNYISPTLLKASQNYNLNSIITDKGLGNYLYQNSIFFDTLKLKSQLNKLNNKNKKTIVQNLLNDPLIKIFQESAEKYETQVRKKLLSLQLKLDSLNRVYMKAQMEFQKNKTFYPDANLTMRIAFGQIKGYKPRDAVYYDYFTTLEGVMEKYDPNNYDFNVPEKLIKLYEQKDYGQYADKDGKMHVCFIANNHTTGGNSGSPVFNAYGEIIGINFDRTWESTMSDIMYDPDRCRNIIVDIRYVLFIIDKFAGAKHLIDEMVLVK